MAEWVFEISGKVRIVAHCQQDAAEAARDAALDVMTEVDRVELLQIVDPGLKVV